MQVLERESLGYFQPLRESGKMKDCLNLGSYNYLGIGDPTSPTKTNVLKTLASFGVSTASPRTALGTTAVHKELENTVAQFVGKPDAMVFGMGFATNANGIPALVGKGGLIVSDSTNHSSIVIGARSSGAKIKVFKHNDPDSLEAVIRQAICEGQPRTHRPWTKILILVEGVYSMEGEMCPLDKIVAIKKKYKCYLYVDEAHSIGAIGATGRGICEHKKVNPADVDLLMGTFTKAFGAVGGYIASSKEVVAYLRSHCSATTYSASMSPVAAQQALSAMRTMMGLENGNLGAVKLANLRENSNFFRQKMKDLGCVVLGDWDSPIIPVLIYSPSKVAAFSRECLQRGIATVVVGFPATPLLGCRTRICISASHCRSDLEYAVKQINEVADIVGIKFAKGLWGILGTQ